MLEVEDKKKRTQVLWCPNIFWAFLSATATILKWSFKKGEDVHTWKYQYFWQGAPKPPLPPPHPNISEDWLKLGDSIMVSMHSSSCPTILWISPPYVKHLLKPLFCYKIHISCLVFFCLFPSKKKISARALMNPLKCYCVKQIDTIFCCLLLC